LSIDQSDILLRLLYRIVYKSSSELWCQKCSTCNDSFTQGMRSDPSPQSGCLGQPFVEERRGATLTKRARCVGRGRNSTQRSPHCDWLCRKESEISLV